MGWEANGFAYSPSAIEIKTIDNITSSELINEIHFRNQTFLSDESSLVKALFNKTETIKELLWENTNMTYAKYEAESQNIMITAPAGWQVTYTQSTYLLLGVIILYMMRRCCTTGKKIKQLTRGNQNRRNSALNNSRNVQQEEIRRAIYSAIRGPRNQSSTQIMELA